MLNFSSFAIARSEISIFRTKLNETEILQKTFEIIKSKRKS